MSETKRSTYNEKSKQRTLRFQKQNLKQIAFMLNKSTEADLLSWLESQENRQGYIKSLIRADMAKHKK